MRPTGLVTSNEPCVFCPYSPHQPPPPSAIRHWRTDIMSAAGDIRFTDILNGQQTWTDYADFCRNIPDIIKNEVYENAQDEARLIRDLKESPEFQKTIVRDALPHLAEAEELLMGGNVVGVDGTMTKYRLLSGTRCLIGVVAVNYAGDQMRHSFFISQASFREEAELVLDRILQRSDADRDLSDIHLRGIMMYKERESGMSPKFDGKYIMYHGPMLPFELMSDLGRLRALDTTLEILRKVVRSERAMSVISATTHRDLMYFGLAIESGQYVTHPDWNLEHYFTTSSALLAYRDKWREDEISKVENFIKDYGSQIRIGVIRVGERPYVFHAHEKSFDLAASILIRDAMLQREKGFPLLIDYADTLCSQYFSSEQFNRMMDWQLAQTNTYLRESGERKMRMK